MNRKPAIRPTHLFLMGVSIIILGILIPSFFINPFSTVGFSIIIGLSIILFAYALFSINTIKNKGTRSIKWLILPIMAVLVAGGGAYLYHSYQKQIKDKVYNIGDVVSLPGFDFKVSSVDYGKIPLDTKGIDITSRKDCSVVPQDQKHDCDWYNWPRRNAQNYLNDNYRANIKYEVHAKEIVQGKDLDISIVPDSGREIFFNDKQSRHGGNSHYGDTFSFITALDLEYTVSPRTDFGGVLNKDITRRGSMEVDLKNSEQVFDVIVKYHGETRTIRVTK